jgi:hypothetical protein
MCASGNTTAGDHPVTTRCFLEICGPHCAKRSVGRVGDFRTSSKARPIRVSEAAKARMLKTDQFMERQSAQTSGAATKNIISEKCNISGEIIK